jgi:hypothetical protein
MWTRPSLDDPNAIDIVLDTYDERNELERLFYEDDVNAFTEKLDAVREGKQISMIWDPEADKSNDLIHYFTLEYDPYKDKPGNSLRALYSMLSTEAKRYYGRYPGVPEMLKTPAERAAPTVERTKKIKQDLEEFHGAQGYEWGVNRRMGMHPGAGRGKTRKSRKTRRSRRRGTSR